MSNLSGELVVEFVGEVHRVKPGHEFTFGRHGDLQVDENPHLHRTLGRFFGENDLWWLANEGSAIALQIADQDSRSVVVLSPGTTVALSFANMNIRFRAGRTDYEIDARLPRAPVESGSSRARPDSADATFGARMVPLTDDQHLALVAMSELALRNPHLPIQVPNNAETAARIDWTLSRFNRKIDNLCEKFTKAGVPGLRGSVDQLATDRRRRLVQHCVDAGVVTAADLAVLDVEARRTGTGPHSC